MNLKTFFLLAPLAALLGAAPVHAAADTDQQKALEQARKELDQARDDLKRAAAEMARVTRERDQDSPRAHAFEFLSDPDRAVLGVAVAPGPKLDGTVRGVVITSVTPDSGADRAGLKTGDVLISVNGQSLTAKAGEQPGPDRKLLAVMGNLKIGDQVSVEYERGGKAASATAIAGRMQDVRRLVLPDFGPMMDFDNDDEHDIILPPELGAPQIHIESGDAWDLAAIDADLAPYFKTDSGVLVVKPAKGSTLGLKGGDVVQKINGGAVKDATALRHQLHELAGKEVALDIVRKGKSESLKGKLPERHKTRVFKKRIEINGDDSDPS